MPTYYYNAETESLRQAIARQKGPTVGLPSNVFPVKTDDGEDIYLPVALFTGAASIVVHTPDCRAGEPFSYSVLVTTNRRKKGVGSDIAGLSKTAAGAITSNIAKTVAGAGLAARFALSQVVGGVVGAFLGADKTGVGADLYHTVRHLKSAHGTPVIVFVGGERQ